MRTLTIGDRTISYETGLNYVTTPHSGKPSDQRWFKLNVINRYQLSRDNVHFCYLMYYRVPGSGSA
jgi:hypothetical protein